MTDLQALLMQLDGEKQFELLPCRAKLNLIKISAITGFIRNKIHRKIKEDLIKIQISKLIHSAILFVQKPSFLSNT